MKPIGNILYLTVPDLVSYEVPEITINQGMARNRKGASSWQHISDEHDSKKKLINYDSIPKSTIEKYGIPTKEELIKSLALETLSREVQINKKDLEYYMNNRTTIDLAHEYSRIAAWLRYCAEIKPSKAVQKGFEDKEHLYDVVVKVMGKEAESMGWKSWGVENIQVFKRRLKPFIQYEKGKGKIEDALDSLVYKRLGVANAQKINEHFEKAILYIYVQKGSGVKLLPDQVHFEYEQIRIGTKMLVDSETGEILMNLTPSTNLPNVCVRTVKNFINEPRIQILTSAMRDGSKYANDKYRPYIMRMKPKYSGSMSSSDGAVIPFRLIINNRLTWKRALAYMIFDVQSECIIGVAYDMEENLQVMNEAFKNMLLWTNGYTPMENQLDNFGRGNKDNLERIFKYVSFCEPYNPQSKYAERLIGHFEGSQLRPIRGWQGTNNQSKKQSGKKNPDIEEVGYTFEDTVKLHQNAVETWNKSVPDWCKSGKTRRQLFEENKNPEALQLQDRELARLAGEWKIGNIVRGFVKVEYDSEKYDFEVYNYAELTSQLNNGWSVRVIFLPHKMDRVWLYNYKDKKDTTEDTYLCECLAVVKPQGAKAEQTAADREALERQMANKVRFDRWVAQEAAKIPSISIIDNAEGAMINEIEAEGILASGYTDKHLMQQAEEAITARKDREMKPDRMEQKQEARERKENSKKLKEILYNVEETTEMELVEIDVHPKTKYSRWD